MNLVQKISLTFSSLAIIGASPVFAKSPSLEFCNNGRNTLLSIEDKMYRSRVLEEEIVKGLKKTNGKLGFEFAMKLKKIKKINDIDNISQLYLFLMQKPENLICMVSPTELVGLEEGFYKLFKKNDMSFSYLLPQTDKSEEELKKGFDNNISLAHLMFARNFLTFLVLNAKDMSIDEVSYEEGIIRDEIKLSGKRISALDPEGKMTDLEAEIFLRKAIEEAYVEATKAKLKELENNSDTLKFIKPQKDPKYTM